MSSTASHCRAIPSISGELQGRLSFAHSCVGSPFKFSKHGASERAISELLPHLAQHVDDMAFIHGIETDNQNHGPSTLPRHDRKPVSWQPFGRLVAELRLGYGKPRHARVFGHTRPTWSSGKWRRHLEQRIPARGLPGYLCCDQAAALS